MSYRLGSLYFAKTDPRSSRSVSSTAEPSCKRFPIAQNCRTLDMSFSTSNSTRNDHKTFCCNSVRLEYFLCYTGGRLGQLANCAAFCVDNECSSASRSFQRSCSGLVMRSTRLRMSRSRITQLVVLKCSRYLP